MGAQTERWTRFSSFRRFRSVVLILDASDSFHFEHSFSCSITERKTFEVFFSLQLPLYVVRPSSSLRLLPFKRLRFWWRKKIENRVFYRDCFGFRIERSFRYTASRAYWSRFNTQKKFSRREILLYNWNWGFEGGCGRAVSLKVQKMPKTSVFRLVGRVCTQPRGPRGRTTLARRSDGKARVHDYVPLQASRTLSCQRFGLIRHWCTTPLYWPEEGFGCAS